MRRFIFVTGGVMSGIGKGVTTASIGRILLARGYSVTALKIDPYLNFDAGTMNPLVHGEVFVTEDGAETDMDIGTYERFLGVNLSRDHNITTGQIYHSVITKERGGKFLGQCVQIIPHVTDEIKSRIRSVVGASGAEVGLVEIGGTVGDIEGLPFLEAARQLRLEEGPRNVLFVHVTLVPVLDVVGEQKTKPTQHSVQELRRIGIQPDVIIVRSKRPLLQEPKRKIALFCNVEERAVFTSPDLVTAYQVPLELDRQGLGDYLCERLGLPKRVADWVRWSSVIEGYVNPEYSVKIALCGKYTDLADSYVSVNEALRHAGAALSTRVDIDWIDTELFERASSKLDLLRAYDGVLVPGGFGPRGAEGKILAIRYARANDIPFLGICFGFQLAVVEHARHIGLEGANSIEINPETPHPVIDLMPEQRYVEAKGGTMRLGAHEITIKPGTLAHRLYGRERIWERHRHRYEVNPEYIDKLSSSSGAFSAYSDNGRRMEIFELSDMRFFLATQFHAEFKSRPEAPSPPYLGFIKAALEGKLRQQAVAQ